MVEKITKYKIIMQFINGHSKKYYLRELAVQLKKPHQTIKPYVEELIKQGILAKIQRKNLTEYGLNFKNKQIYNYLVITEKEILIKKLNKEILLRILFEKLSPFFPNNTFLIFGSSVKKIKKTSDIDLLIIGKSNLTKTLDDFEKIYNKKIHKIQVTNFNKMNNTITQEIYKKHLIFNNTERVLRFYGDGKNNLV